MHARTHVGKQAREVSSTIERPYLSASAGGGVAAHTLFEFRAVTAAASRRDAPTRSLSPATPACNHARNHGRPPPDFPVKTIRAQQGAARLAGWLAGSSVGNAQRPTVVTEPGLRARRAFWHYQRNQLLLRRKPLPLSRGKWAPQVSRLNTRTAGQQRELVQKNGRR